MQNPTNKASLLRMVIFFIGFSLFSAQAVVYAADVSSYSYFYELLNENSAGQLQLIRHIYCPGTSRVDIHSVKTINGLSTTLDGATWLSIYFTSSTQGGLFLNENSILQIINSNLNFSESGTAISAFPNSILTVSNSSGVFNNNNATTNGGAFDFSSSSGVFSNTIFKFDSNSSSQYGGAIAAENNASIFFSTSHVVFVGNSAKYGGSVATANSGGNFTIKNSELAFLNNTADLGGAVYVGSKFSVLSTQVNFIDNVAKSSGGAIFVASGGKLSIETGPRANINFIGNSAEVAGGALYMSQNSAVTIMSNGGKVIFSENRSAGKSNDIYLEQGSNLQLQGYNNEIIIESGINSVGRSSIIKSGGESLSIGGDSDIGSSLFSIVEGDMVLLKDANLKGNGAVLMIDDFSKFNMANSFVNTVAVATFVNRLEVEMDVFSCGKHDAIIADNATLGYKLSVRPSLGTYGAHREYLLIQDTGFDKGITIFSLLDTNLKIIGGYDFDVDISKGLFLKLGQDFKVGTNFSSLEGLTYNQFQMAKNYDALTLTSFVDVDNFGDVLNVVANDTTDSRSTIREFLKASSPYFYANVVRGVASVNDNKEIYDKMWSRIDNKSNFWIQTVGEKREFREDGNSTYRCINRNYGLMFAFDSYITDNFKGGIFGKYLKNDIAQGNNSAEVDSFGGGFYGGYIGKNVELKALLSGMQNRYLTERVIDFNEGSFESGNVANAEFLGVSVGVDLEFSYKMLFSEKILISPFAGVEFRETAFKSFTEKGVQPYNFEICDTDYLRGESRVGARVRYDNYGWSWYGSVYGLYLFSGKEPEIEASFDRAYEKFKAKGFSEKELIAVLGLGLSKEISKNIKLYIDCGYSNGAEYRNISANFGIRYNFGQLGEAVDIVRRQKTSISEAMRDLGKDDAEAEDYNCITLDSFSPPPFHTKEAAMLRREKISTARLQEPVIRNGEILGVLRQVTVNTTHFEIGDFDLTAKAKKIIAEIAKTAIKKSYSKITVEGHTDNTGSEQINNILSLQRALVVVEQLMRQGVDISKIQFANYGYTIPVASNETSEGRSLNRRTEIFVE
ncbi:MAG: autotransporter domain-containing protein [Elusimicrobiota bacterium]|jgi:predicted outer membrane repeat protein|nr:autotransporter domain-containing protein [Elusimicrobiota bacterium]